jgi:transposase
MSIIQEILERCAGLDVHKKTIVVTIMIGFGENMKAETKTFKTFTPDLRSLAQWLLDNGIKKCVIESTGPYWKPAFNILEGEFNLEIILANAYQVKNHPNRKSDVKDSEWLCRLLKTGFINKSFIPPIDIRELRDIVRLRKTRVAALTAEKNRLNKTLESKNIKLSSVLSNIYGAIGFQVIRLIASGENRPEKLIECFNRSVKASRDEIKAALTGKLETQDITLIKHHLRYIDDLVILIEELDKEINNLMNKYKTEADLLKTIPGIGDKIAKVIVAEAGNTMLAFPTVEQFTSWTGLVPRTNESAGIRKNTSISGGNGYIREAFVEAAWAASKVKKSYWYAEFHRLRSRLGTKKAIVALARKIAECAYSVLRTKKSYQERGALVVDERIKKRQIKYYQKKLAELGAIISPVAENTQAALQLNH